LSFAHTPPLRSYIAGEIRSTSAFPVISGTSPNPIDYGSLIDDQEGLRRELISYCGLEWQTRCLSFHETERHVATASRLQVRRSLYRSSVQRWRNYERFLGPLQAALIEGDHNE